MNVHKALQLITPTPLQALGCFTSALLILLISYWNIIIQVVANGFGIDQETLAISLTHQASALNNLPYASRIPGIIFWFIVLMTMYVGYLRIHNALVELYNEYVVATEFTGQPGIGAHLWQVVPRIVLYAGFLVALLVSWKALGPFWLGFTGDYVWSLFLPQFLPQFIFGTFGLTLNLYALLVVVQLIIYE